MQVQKQEMRDELIKAASILFARKGVKNTSLKKIADQAHTTVGNIYNYFPNKEAILDTIAEQTDSRLDKYFESRFNEIIDRVGLDKLYEIVHILILDREQYEKKHQDQYAEIHDEQFVALLEGCEGTKYERYKDSLINAVNNLWGEHIADPELYFFRKSISQFFIEILLENSKQKLFGTEIKKDARQLFEQCRADRDDISKTITYTLVGYVEAALLYHEEFLKLYYSVHEGIETAGYTAIFDCTQIEQGNSWEIYDKFLDLYCETPYKHRQLIFTHEQIGLMLQVKRGLEAACRTDYELIIRHKISQNKIANVGSQ